MVARPDTSVAPSTGIEDIAKVLREFAQSNKAVYGELLSTMRDLRMSTRATSGAQIGRGAKLIDFNAGDVQEALGTSNAGGPSQAAPGFPVGGAPKGRSRKMVPVEVVPSSEVDAPEEVTETLRVNAPFPQGATPAPYRNLVNLPRTFKEGKAKGLKGVKNDFISGLTQRLNDVTLGGDMYEQVHAPSHLSLRPGDLLDHSVFTGEEFAASNWQTQSVWRNKRTQQVVHSAVAEEGQRSLARATMLKDAIAGYSETGSLMGGVANVLPMVGKAAGAAGIAVAGAQQAQKLLADQTEANRPYQRVLGGGINEGYSERLRQNLFRIGNKFSLNPISDRDSNTIYEGALDLYAGDRHMRSQAQSVMTDLLRTTGMRPEDSLKVITTAAKAGNEALAQVALSLKEVTKSAREAGVNADEARDRFGAAYASMSKSVGGTSAVLVAQSQTEAVTSMGHRFGDVTFDNGTSQDVYQSMQTGQNFGQLYASRNSAGGAQAYAASQQQRRTDAAKMLFGNKVQEAMARRGISPGSSLTATQQQQIANEVMAETGTAPQIVAQTLGNLGGMQGLTAANAPVAAVQVLAGGVDQVGELQKKVGDLEQDTMGFKSTMSKVGDVNQQQGYAERSTFLKDHLGLSENEAKKAIELARSGANPSGRMGAIVRYLRIVEKTGKTDPIQENLIKAYDNSRRYKVHTASGDRVVGNFELMQDFADQARTGEVEIVQGEGAGDNISSLLGVPATDMPGYQDPEEADSAKSGSLGKKYDDKKWEEHESEKANGTIIVKAAPDLQRWLDFQGTGAAKVASTAASSGYVSPDSRATGGH